MDDDSAETCSERTIDNDLDMCNVTDVHCGLFRPASIIVDAHSPPATPDIFAAPLVSKPSQVRKPAVTMPCIMAKRMP